MNDVLSNHGYYVCHHFLQTLMSAYLKNFICALLLLNVRTRLVPTNAVVSQDSMGMASLVRILMSAGLICIIAVFMHSVTTLLALMPVNVFLALKETDGLVRILTSARLICTTAVFMHSAIILLDYILVVVFLALKEMAGRATTSMNARMGITSVTHTQHVQTLKALMNAAAFLGFMVMVMCV